MTQTPCQATALTRGIWFAHLLHCPDERCRESGAEMLEALASFRRGGATIDSTAFVPLADKTPTETRTP